MKKRLHTILSISLAANALLFLASMSFAQELEKTAEELEAEDAAALAKATQNPLAAMYSLPFQNNSTFNVGTEKRTQNVLNIQPVIPISLGEGVNLINRVIIPIITQPYGNDGTTSSTGIGDISYTAWFSPIKHQK